MGRVGRGLELIDKVCEEPNAEACCTADIWSCVSVGGVCASDIDVCPWDVFVNEVGEEGGALDGMGSAYGG